MDASIRLRSQEVAVTFHGRAVLRGLSVAIRPRCLTVIIGPNGCGKSTFLRTLARLQKPSEGTVVLDGKAVAAMKTRTVARELAILPQGPTAPEEITVRDLVSRGRLPHQSPLRQWSRRDAEVVQQVLERTRLGPLAEQRVAALSGGQRQRVWIAMTLAQDTDILFLDEPTTYLDLPHQIELLDLIQRLAKEEGKAVVTVLHDINLAARFADRIIALKDGQIAHDGPPAQVITAETMADVYGLACTVITDPVHGKPFIIPA
jgi:iron complex transport system ATP-binding protein